MSLFLDRGGKSASKTSSSVEPFEIAPPKAAAVVHRTVNSAAATGHKPAAPHVSHTAHGGHSAHAPAAGHAAHAPRGHFHPLPVIGHAEAFYLKHIQQAEAAGDHIARGSHKVGQHVTAALDPNLSWEQKLKRFVHCLHHYCVTPADADEGVRIYYGKIGDLVRRHAGQEALHLCRARHGEYQRRLHKGESRDTIENEAETFFPDVLGHGGRPEWCSNEAWTQLALLRDHWV